MDLESILIEYGKIMNIGRLQLDSSGICTLLVNDSYLVSFEKSLDKEGFYVYSSIGHVPVGKEEQFFSSVLKGNLFGKETGQSSIGYVEETRTLVLFEYFDSNTIDYAKFFHRFNLFIQHLFYWIVKLDSSEQLDTHHEDQPAHKKIFYA